MLELLLETSFFKLLTLPAKVVRNTFCLPLLRFESTEAREKEAASRLFGSSARCIGGHLRGLCKTNRGLRRSIYAKTHLQS